MLSDTISYITLFALTIVFTAFALAIQENVWRILLKMIAGLFWMVMAISSIFFFGSSSFLMVMSLPYAMIGMIFWILIIYDVLKTKHDQPFIFED
jgi:uncharacterized membrane protein